MIVDKRLNNLADAYCRANNREFKYLWLKKIMEYMRKIDNKKKYNYENDILDFIDIFDRDYSDCTDEEYKMRTIPKPFNFEVNVI